jgi:hypothetical protein
MKERHDAGDLGRIYYSLSEDGDYIFGKRPSCGTWWDKQRGVYDSSSTYTCPGPPLDNPRHPSLLIGRPVHVRFDWVDKMPDRISARLGSPQYSGFYSERFLEGLDEIGITVPYQEVEYGLPLDPLTAEERAKLGRRYYVLKFEETEVGLVDSAPHAIHYYGEADLFLKKDGQEAFTHPVMEMVHRKKLTGFGDRRYYTKVGRFFWPKMPPCPSYKDDKEGYDRWRDEKRRKSAAYHALPDPPFKDRSWPGPQLDYLLANGYSL